MQNPVDGSRRQDSASTHHMPLPPRLAQDPIHTILDSIPDSFVALDSEWRYIYCNRSAERRAGRSRMELLGKNIFEEYPFLKDTVFEKQYRMAMAEQVPLCFEAEAYGRWFEICAYPSAEELILHSRDITARRQREEELHCQLIQIQAHCTELERKNGVLEAANSRLEMLAATDSLTGLNNYRCFHERIVQEFQRCVRHKLSFSLLLLDVDHFKQFNDTFGHPAGDRALREIASLLKTCARSTDVVARYGGEEFAVLLPETLPHHAIEVAERMRSAVEAGTQERRPLTVSFGVATFKQTTSSHLGLLEEADQALYRSKHKGKNCVTHYDDAPGFYNTAITETA